MSETLPATSYIKMIDVCLLFDLIVPFTLIVLHTFMDYLKRWNILYFDFLLQNSILFHIKNSRRKQELWYKAISSPWKANEGFEAHCFSHNSHFLYSLHLYFLCCWFDSNKRQRSFGMNEIHSILFLLFKVQVSASSDNIFVAHNKTLSQQIDCVGVTGSRTSYLH